ncbi:MAG: XRE family transcriptional regulator [Clostridia bacterium]|nr:XRE family transcriptional regulator [Clostridia bacterium]
MEIGEKIRDMRLACDLTQEELADRCELTKGYISQLENDLTSPSIATLIDILSALGTNLKDSFSDPEEEKVVFSKTEFIEKVQPAYKLNWVVPNSQKNIMEPVLMELNPMYATEEDYAHEGEEFGFVLEGEIILVLGKKRYVVRKGESFYFTPNRTHYLVNKKQKKAVLLWVSCPPNF